MASDPSNVQNQRELALLGSAGSFAFSVDERALASDVYIACVWEVSARKAGNVHRFADFDDLTFLDFVRSADAIAPVLASHQHASLGVTILRAIQATRRRVATNTNLGIVLLLAPLSKCEPYAWRAQIATQLERTSIADAALTYEAIRLAMPGGLGRSDQQDIAMQPTQPLRDVMALAADRDLVARQYANGFQDILDEGVPALLEAHRRFGRIELAILQLQLHWLSRFPDSLIARKRGPEEAREVSRRACKIDLSDRVGRRHYLEFDRWLREPGQGRNPGTTADLVAACLFIALREHRMNRHEPFSCWGRDRRYE